MTEIISFVSRRDQLIADVRANISEIRAESAKLISEDASRFTYAELLLASNSYDDLFGLLQDYDSEEFDVFVRFAYYASLVCKTRDEFEALKSRARVLAESVFDFNASEADRTDLLDPYIYDQDD